VLKYQEVTRCKEYGEDDPCDRRGSRGSKFLAGDVIGVVTHIESFPQQQALIVEAKPGFEGDLVVIHRFVLDITANLIHFKPVRVFQ
jgi:hypothetical protein